MSGILNEIVANAAHTASQRAHVASLLARLCEDLQAVLQRRLIGIYIYGSLVTGDFDCLISDLDLVIIMSEALDERLFMELHELHARIISDNPSWDNRLELAYISAEALRSFMWRSSRIGIISPGEPFHIIEAGADWLISWYALREHGIPLHGPPIAELLDRLPKSAWLEAVREHIRAYRKSVKDAQEPAFLAYIVVTVARGLYTLAHERDASKIRAAKWLASEKPKWRELIELAMWIRQHPEAPVMPREQLRLRVEAFLRDVLGETKRSAK